MLKLKLQYSGHLLQRTDSLEKALILGKIEGRRRRGQQRMRELDLILNGHEFEQTLGESLQLNRELPDVEAGFRKGKETRDQIANICWIIEKATEFQKHIYFCFIDYTKAFDCMDHNKLWKILKEMGIPDHLKLPLEKSVCRSGSNS